MFPSTFRRLEVFVAVVDAGSFVAAAERLGISHPSVSNHIQALERQIRCELFLRRRGAVSSLTEQGRRVYERGLELLDKSDSLARELALAADHNKRFPLTLATQRGVAGGWLCRPLVAYAKTHPEIDFSVNVAKYEIVVSDVIEGRADLGFLMAFGPIMDLPCEKIGRDRFSFFAAANHPLAARDKITPQELAAHPFLSTRRDGRYSQMLHNMMRSVAIPETPIACLGQDGSVIQELAIQGMGIFLGPDRQSHDAIAAGKLIRLPVDVPDLHMDVYYALSPKRKQMKATGEFLENLKSFHARIPGIQ